MAKDSEEYRVQINAVFTIKSKDKLEAMVKVTQAVGMLKPAGCVNREIKWSGILAGGNS